MKFEKSETNNAIIVKLSSVRKHPNADRLKLANVLGTQVVVSLDAKDGDLMIYFDSNLCLSHSYLKVNNLYSSKELNEDNTKKGYFGKKGRVRSQKFRGEVSNGFVADLDSVLYTGIEKSDFQEGMEFHSINGNKICKKYIIPRKNYKGVKKLNGPISTMFHKHWDTKQLMRQLEDMPENADFYIEEKIHGTSGRTGNVMFKTRNSWWKFWKPRKSIKWEVVSGTRRVDNIDFHLSDIRKEIQDKVSPHLHKGEEIYYEIYGYNGGSQIQKGFAYNCSPAEYKCMLYRVTITTPDGFCVDLNRQQVYKRAEELGLEKPFLLVKAKLDSKEIVKTVKCFAVGKSNLDMGTLLEGVVIWFEDNKGNWNCLKHKSEEFLMDQDKKMEKGEGDVEDNL